MAEGVLADLPAAVGLIATPLVADGVMSFVGSRHIVHAVSGTPGELHGRYGTPSGSRVPAAGDFPLFFQ